GRNDPRPSLALRLGIGKSAFSLVVAVTKQDSGNALTAYMNALEEAIGGDVLGAVLVRPTGSLSVGPRTRARAQYEAAVGSGKLRPFPLDSERLDFEHMECLFEVLQKAEVGDLQLAGRPLSAADCRRLILELKLLDNLKLFQFIFAG